MRFTVYMNSPILAERSRVEWQEDLASRRGGGTYTEEMGAYGQLGS
jgi:hypothetical protein